MLSATLLACAVGVAPATMDRIIAVESGAKPFAVHINGLAGTQPTQPTTTSEAVAVARRFIAAGYSVDLGLAQVNSRNLARVGLTLEDAFDGCKNIAAGGVILSGFYGQAVQHFGEGQHALMAALSSYNTGNMVGGFQNGYVGKYYINTNLPAATPASRMIQIVAVSAPPSMVVYDRPGYSLTLH